MKTLLEVIQYAEFFLRHRGIDNSRREAEYLLADLLGLPLIDLYLEFENPIREIEIKKILSAVIRRGNHEPSAYILGKVSFCDITIKVNSNVLIPRQETEILVNKIIEKLKKYDLTGKTLWDMCCGSGCIGHALKKKFPLLNVVLSDLSEKALDVARQNGGDVSFRQGNLFDPFRGEVCDFFVCNPPYVDEHEYEELSLEVKTEPKMALVGGLSFYKAISRSLFDFLKPGGMAWLEIGTGQGDSVKKLFNNQGKVENDWAGHNRFFSLERD
ncbi:MAG: peptide chain release factor N(5)-glutamine methyltransferase [Chlamydiales bacterium]